MAGKNDFENYRRVSEPFASMEEANEAMKSFFDAVEKIRNEFRIKDVHFIAEVNAIQEDGEEGVSIVDAHFGAAANAPLLCAYGLGQSRERFDSALRVRARGD